MRVALVNLPYPERVMRRWVASYHAPNFLMPPLELMALGAIVKEWKGQQAVLVDAIAEGWDAPRVIEELRSFAPDLVVALAGFGTFPRDLASLEKITAGLPGAKSVCFGYLPTLLAEEILSRTAIDVVIRGEPELAFAEVLDRLLAGDGLAGVAGVTYREAGTVRANAERPRIEDLDALPFPDHGLLRLERYNESYLERPIGVIMSERGCPFGCTYCVRTYGRRLVSRSAESILAEIRKLRQEHGIRNIRFMDDTLTINRQRLVRICEGLLDGRLGIAWTCLTRVDMLDAELLALMRRAGCRRLYVGIESGSQRVLDYYEKGLTVEKIRQQMAVVRQSGIECSAFFVVGAPIETDDDVERSISLAIELDLDYVIVTKLQFWPGTELLTLEQARVAFDAFGRGELLYEVPGYERARDWQRRFYRRFYLRPRYVWRRFRTLAASPRDTLVGLAKLSAFLLRRQGWDDFI